MTGFIYVELLINCSALIRTIYVLSYRLRSHKNFSGAISDEPKFSYLNSVCGMFTCPVC